MKKFGLFIIAISIIGCGDDGDPEDSGDPLSCDWDQARLLPGEPPLRPTGRSGELLESLQGKWQHTYTVSGPGMSNPTGEGVDIRYMFDGDVMNFCQHITGVVEVGPDSNQAEFTLEGDTINLGVVTYTAIAWSEDVMVWNNDSMQDEQYILQRR